MKVLGMLAFLGALFGVTALLDRKPLKTRTFYRDGVRAIIERCSDDLQSKYVAAGWKEYL